MKMKFLEYVLPPPDIYHVCSTQKTIWEEKFTPVNITSSLRFNVRNHREINNDKQFIILDISSKLYCMKKRQVTSPDISTIM